MKKIVVLIFFISLNSFAQEKHRFADEVQAIQKKYDSVWNAQKETIVFTGSSSIRMWESLERSFPDNQIVNSGFGGSQFSDLRIFSNELIHRFNPEKVFIYEGDNDLNASKKSKEILGDLHVLIAEIQAKNKQTKIALIAVKPSISRWHLKAKYKRLNRKYKKLAQRNSFIQFVDVWTPMLKGRKVNKELFRSDGLHMNAKGYQIWYKVIKPYIDN